LLDEAGERRAQGPSEAADATFPILNQDFISKTLNRFNDNPSCKSAFPRIPFLGLLLSSLVFFVAFQSLLTAKSGGNVIGCAHKPIGHLLVFVLIPASRIE
jgi:hypothetical protein